MYKYKMIMKKILLGLALLAITTPISAQLKLERVLDGAILLYNEGLWTFGVDDLIFMEGNDDKLYAYYKTDFTLYGVFDTEKVDIITRNIVTTDNKLCFISENSEGDYRNSKSTITILNESMQVIQEMKLDGVAEGDYHFVKIGDQYKFFLSEHIGKYDAETGEYLGSTSKTYIYSCPGNGETTTSVENMPAKVKRNAYPNPATDLVTLPYDANGATSMKIYDMQGKLVERKFLDKNKQELQLNVKDYPSGMYFFEVNGESNSFIVE